MGSEQQTLYHMLTLVCKQLNSLSLATIVLKGTELWKVESGICLFEYNINKIYRQPV